MSIITKLLVILFVNTTWVIAVDDENTAPLTAEEQIRRHEANWNESSATHDVNGQRSARRSFEKLKEAIDKLKMEADLGISRLQLPDLKEFFENPQLGSLPNITLPSIKQPSLYDASATSLATGSSDAFNLFSLFSPQQPQSAGEQVGNQQSSVAVVPTSTQTPATAAPATTAKTTKPAVAAKKTPAATAKKTPTSAAATKSQSGNVDGKATSEPNVGDSKSKLIVQPDDLVEDNDNAPAIPNLFAHITTRKQLKETAAIRNEIKYAVDHHLYAHTSADVVSGQDRQSEPPRPQKLPSPPKPTQPPQPLQPPQPFFPPQPTQPPQPLQPTQPTQPPQPLFPIVQPTFPDIFSFWRTLISQKPTMFGPLQTDDGESDVGAARTDFSFDPNANPATDNIPKPSENPSSPQNVPHSVDISDVDAENEAAVKQMMAKIAQQAKNEGIVSNTVESYASGSNTDKPAIEMSRVRETLVMKSISEDLQFKIGENVRAWKTLKRNARDAHALIGLTNSSVVLVHEKNGVYTLQSEIALLTMPTCFATFTYWNQTQRSIDGIVMVGIEHVLIFLRVNEAMDRMHIIWTWQTNRPLTAVQHFVIDGADMALLVTNANNAPAASVYRFDMNHREFYLRESISLQVQVKTMAHFQNERDTFLCFPQNTNVAVYKYVKDRFRYFTKITSANADTVSAFEMGGYSYLAVGGTQPKILRFHRGTFYDQTIFAKSWGSVEYFLPIPSRTYRDDLILLIQHRINFGTHFVPQLEALIWNGEAFDPALSVPCFINNRQLDVGLGCMLDVERDAGMIGAAVFQRNRTISILTPRHQAPSGLFDLQIELLPAVYTYDEQLLELFSEVVILLQSRDETLTSAKDILENFAQKHSEEIVVTNQVIDKAYAHELELGTTMPTEGIFYNDELVTSEKVAQFMQLLNETQANVAVLQNQNRNRREANKHSEHIELQAVNANHLNVNFINGIPAEDFIFIKNNCLQLNGTVMLSQSLDVDSVVEKNTATDEIVNPPQEESTRSMDDGQMIRDAVDRLHIPGDFSFDEINGVAWNDLVHEIVMKNLPNNLPDIQINGLLRAENNLNVENLNALPFPSGYVLNDGNQDIVITGSKTFSNVLGTKAVDCAGTINGIDPATIVTLNGSQVISGTTTFRQLEVTETLEVSPNATISGRRLDEFLANPTLQQTNHITSNCFIDSIEVDGSIFIQDTLNGLYLDDVLGDVVYNHEPMPKCKSFKTFQSISAPNIRLTSNLINEIPLNAFVTSDTDQVFNVRHFHGDIFFKRLNLDGLFNFVNVTELDENAIKLFGDQYTDAELVFEKGSFLDIDAAELEIQETINNLNVSDFVSIDENFELFGNVILNTVVANECVIGGEIIAGAAQASINGWPVRDLQESYLSRKKDQQIQAPIYVNTAIIRGGFNANHVNGYDFKEALRILKDLKTNEQLLKDPVVSVKRMIVQGNISFNAVNGFDIAAIEANAIRLDQPNTIQMPVSFLDPMNFNGNLTVDRLNNFEFNTFVEDLVKKSDEQIIISGTTIFRENVIVHNDIQATTVNNYGIDQILTKNYRQPIANQIHIYGDVTVSNLRIDGTFNGLSGQRISDTYSFDETLQSHVLNTNVYFNQTTYVNYLTLEGGYNNVANATYYLATSVRKNRPAVITGTKTFTDDVRFENDLHVLDYNEIDVQSFLTNVILIDQTDAVDLNSHVIFEDSVILKDLKVNGDLVVTSVANCSVSEWYTNAIHTDSEFAFNGMIMFAEGTFESSNINVRFLNEKRMDFVLTLNTPQNFSEPVRFDEIESMVPITTDGYASEFNLQQERDNTFMVYGTQYITAPIVFQSIRVLKDLVTTDTVNNRDIKSAVSILSDIYLDSPLSFASLSVNNLQTKDLVSGISFDKWMQNSFRRWSMEPQIVTGHWTIRDANIDSIISDLGVNGMEVSSFIQQLVASNKMMQTNYMQTCNKVQDLITDSQNNELYLSHFENAFKLTYTSTVNSIYLFEIGQQNYLLVSTGCDTFFYVWNDSEKRYDELCRVNTGFVGGWIHVLNLRNVLHFVSNGGGTTSACTISGANIWQYDPVNLAINRLVNFGNDTDFKSLQIKPNSRAFFYALRNRDNRVIEFNLRGVAVTEWQIENQIETPSSQLRFVPVEANLGLAISDGESLSLLTAYEDVAQRKTRCCIGAMVASASPDWPKETNEKQNSTRQAMVNLRHAFAQYRTAVKENLLTKFQNRRKQMKAQRTENFQKLRALMQDSDTVLGSSIDQSATTEANKDAQMVGEGLTGKVIVDLMDKIYKILQKNKMKHKMSDYEASHELHNVASQLKTSKLNPENGSEHIKFHAANDSSNNSNLLGAPESTFTRDMKKVLVDGLNAITHLVEQSNQDDDDEAEGGEDDRDDGPRSDFAVGISIDNVGNLTATETAKKKQGAEDPIPNIEDKVLSEPSHKLNSMADTQKQIVEFPEKSSLSASNSADHTTYTVEKPVVGDKFGDLIEKLTPLVDILTDKVVEELRRRKQKKHDAQYEVGMSKSETAIGSTETMPNNGKNQTATVPIASDDKLSDPEVRSVFKKIGRKIVNFYHSAKKVVIKDAKYLSSLYHKVKFVYANFHDDNINDNKSYGAPDVHGLDIDIRQKPSHVKHEHSIKLEFTRSKENETDRDVELDHGRHPESDYEKLKRILPDSDSIVTSYTVQLLKAFESERNTTEVVGDDQMDPNVQGIWSNMKNAINYAFDRKSNEENINRSPSKTEVQLKDSSNTLSSTKGGGHQNGTQSRVTDKNEEDQMLGEGLTGKEIVDLMDKIDEILKKNKLKPKHIELEDAMVGKSFSKLLDKFTPLVDKISDKILDELWQRQHKSNTTRGAESVTDGDREILISFVKKIDDSLKKTQIKHVKIEIEDEIGSNLKMQLNKTVLSNETDAENETIGGDPTVGDKFGDLLEKLTPLVDKLTDKIIAELRRRQQKNYDAEYDSGAPNSEAVASGANETISTVGINQSSAFPLANENKLNDPEVRATFRKFGHTMANVYHKTVHFLNLEKNAMSFFNVAKEVYSKFTNGKSDIKNGPEGNDSSENGGSGISDYVSVSRDKEANEYDVALHQEQDHESDYAKLKRLLPDSDLIVASFTVELIKAFEGGQNSSKVDDDQMDPNIEGIWCNMKNSINYVIYREKIIDKIESKTEEKIDTQTTNLPNNTLSSSKESGNQNNSQNKAVDENSDDQMVGKGLTGKVIVDLMDKIDVILKKNKLKPKHIELEDPVVGDKFGDLLDKFTPIVDHLSEKIIDEIRQRQQKHDTLRSVDSQTDEDREIFINFIGKMDETLGKNQMKNSKSIHEDDVNVQLQKTATSNETIAVDPTVGDKFGDLLEKLTPLVDKLTDKVVEELRRRQQTKYYAEYDLEIPPSETSAQGSNEAIQNNGNNHTSGFPLEIVLNDTEVRATLRNVGHTVTNVYHKTQHIIKNKKAQEKNQENDYVKLKRILPDSNSIVASFTVQMIKAFQGGQCISKVEDEETDSNIQAIWSDMKNAIDFVLWKENIKSKNASKTEANIVQPNNLSNSTLSSSNEGGNQNGTQNDATDKNNDGQMLGEGLTGKVIVDLMDKIDEILKKNKLKPKHFELEDPVVGDKFGDLLDKFTPIVDHLSDKVIDEIRQRQQKYDTMGRSADSLTDEDRKILVNFMGKMGKTIENNQLKHLKNKFVDVIGSDSNTKINDSVATHPLGKDKDDSVEKLTPLVGNLTGKVVEENRQLNPNKDHYELKASESKKATPPANTNATKSNNVKHAKANLNVTMEDVVKKLLDRTQMQYSPHVEMNDPSDHVRDPNLQVPYKQIGSLVIDVIKNRLDGDKAKQPMEHAKHISNHNGSKTIIINNYNHHHYNQHHDSSQKPHKEFRSKTESDEEFDNEKLLGNGQSHDNDGKDGEFDCDEHGERSKVMSEIETTIITMPNHFLPSHQNGEIVAVTVGPDRKTLIVVSAVAENVIKGNHDRIQIFEDVIEGNLFQTIPCYKPHSVTTFKIGVDTILAFVQGETTIRIFIYRGIQGFTEFMSIELPSPIKQMNHNQIVANTIPFACPENYIALVAGNEVSFLKVITIGKCKVSDKLKC